MSQLSTVKHSRNQWKHKAKERGDQDRSLRKQLARVKAERDQAKQALKEAQARRRQLESPAQAVAVLPKVDVVWISLQLFLEAHISFRAVSRVLTLLAHALGRAIQFSERGCKSSLKRVKGFCSTWGFA